MSDTLGMLGPVLLEDFREYLYPGQWRENLPKGLGGTPVNLLARELLRRGRKLVVISLDPSVKDEVILEGEGLRLCVGPFRYRRARDFFKVEREYLTRTIAREQPDVLHAQWTYEFAMAAQASGLPHAITAHDAPINILRQNFIPYRLARTLMAYRVLTRAKRVISVSPYVAGHLRRFMGYGGLPQIVPNGMPAELFERISEARRNTGPLTFATILSNWGQLKNGSAAIEAFSQHRRSRPDDRLLMFGAGHGRGEAAEQWAKACGMNEGIEFAGLTPYAETMRRLGAEVDVLVHPSLEEAQPMVLIEAMAMRIPVIAGKNSGGVPWTLDEGRAGLLVDVRSVSALAEAMSMLADQPDQRAAWGERGRALAENRFHIRAVADAYEKIYEEMRRAA